MIGFQGHNPPRFDCVGGRFSHICEPHHEQGGAHEGSREPRDPPRPKACKILDSTAPEEQQLVISVPEGGGGIDASTKDWDQDYSTDEMSKARRRLTFTVGINHPEGSPDKIIVTDIKSHRDHVEMQVNWNGFKETIDCANSPERADD